ncbi:ABC transporter substrate-binding protein [Variovorax ginsengisoli]|uniref:ABC transporter substrate-binding protein n=1 Tax=Variovorax ginsengisoli TaxID=363844 RepID=A0ABT8RZI1_9BURK|nr:ABC transporter substrate-binding protein [Variovorax ginsengisoli]MDN8612907.1 ABC transporter substrate-binding protein [Variovorax ginsengisoli]MDO1532077.1 ABC transporter substrate-binding protein [Variovorax ginsengisoli]
MRRFVPQTLAAFVLTAAALAAQAQGTVNALCSTDAGWCEAAAAEFSRATGIRVLQAHKGTGEIGAQLRAEAANPKTDIWWGGTGDPFLQAAEEGLLEPYRPAYINDLYDWSVRQYAMSGNRVGGFYTSAMGFGFNTEVLKKKHLPEPRCWADLVKPEYKGEIEMSHPATSGTGYTIVAGLVQLMGEDAAFDYLKRLHRNTTTYTRSGQAQAPNVAKGEVAVGISFIFGFDKWRQDKYPVKAAAPCEGTGYEIGGIALVKGARNKANAQRYYDWLMSPAGQAIGAQAGSLQSPANRTFKPDPRIPSMDGVKLIKYDFEKYGQAAERKRLIDRWTREVESQPR